MDIDVIIIGGGLGGSTLASVLARQGRRVLVLERETRFKDRVRGEQMLPWGVAAARRLGVLDDILAAGGHLVPRWNIYGGGGEPAVRPLPETTPSGEQALDIYHPDLQEALLARAVRDGAEVRRGVTVESISAEPGRPPSVSYTDGSGRGSTAARLIVGADGRSSNVRAWGGFRVERDSERLHIAGVLLQGTCVPDDAVHLSFGENAVLMAPLGRGRARTYFVYPIGTGARQLSGKEKIGEFLALCREAGARPEWLDGVEAVGPLADFDGADQWVTSPAREGLALIGDAAAATDPSWGCGLSKTLLDVEALAGCLAETDDWSSAALHYASRHDDLYGKLHRVLGWWTDLFWTPGPEAEARLGRVLPRLLSEPFGFPDFLGQGPDCPSDESARRLILGLD